MRRARSRLAIRVSVLALALLTTREGRAEPSLELTWSAPPGCPDKAWVESAVVHLVTKPTSRPLMVTGTVREVEGRWAVDLEFRGGATGKRTLGAATCASVSRGAALIVALALDSQARFASESAEDTERAEPSRPEPAPPPDPSPPPPPPAHRDESNARSIRPTALAGIAASRAFVPGVAPAAVVGGGIVWRRLRVDLSAELAATTSSVLAARRRVGADFGLASIALRTCLGFGPAWFSIDGCTALRGARIAGEGTGLAESYRQDAHVLSVEPGMSVRFPQRAQIALELDGAVVLPLTRPEFVILSSGPSQPLFQVLSVGVRVGLGAGVRF